MTSINRIGPQETRNTTQNKKFNHRRLCELRYETKTFKTQDTKWQCLRDKEEHKQLIIYWDRGSNKDADYSTKHYSPNHHRQMRPHYMHTSNLKRKIPQTMRWCKVVLNWVPCTQSFTDSLKPIQEEPQSMNDKCLVVRHLNRSRKYIL